MHYAGLFLVMFEEDDLWSFGSFAVVSVELHAVNGNIPTITLPQHQHIYRTCQKSL